MSFYTRLVTAFPISSACLFKECRLWAWQEVIYQFWSKVWARDHDTSCKQYRGELLVHCGRTQQPEPAAAWLKEASAKRHITDPTIAFIRCAEHWTSLNLVQVFADVSVTLSNLWSKAQLSDKTFVFHYFYFLGKNDQVFVTRSWYLVFLLCIHPLGFIQLF